MRRSMLSGIFAMVLIGSGYASAAESKPALDGNCPVCLVRMDKLVKGDPKLWSVHDGRTYLFPGAEQKRMFDANPTAFVPALGGDCTVCKVEMGKKVAGNPEFHSVRNGRLYLFPSEKQKRMFDQNPDKYADADVAMGGNCPVCLVKTDKVVLGKAEYASAYDGQRYLFPGPEQKTMFDADPASFAPAMRGNCSVCKVEMGKEVPGTADFYLTYNGRLYLFASAKQQQMFQSNPDRYADADLAMNGYCPVCKVEDGKDVKGKRDFAADYNSKRYLFPGKKQLDMFRENPTKYAIE